MGIRLGVCAALLFCGAAQAGVDQTTLADPADGTNWAAWGRNFDEQRFSPLDQINRDSVDRLGLAWSYELDDVWSAALALPIILKASQLPRLLFILLPSLRERRFLRGCH